ncbi:MAG: hypothetical protein CL609_14935 [Anaerolineaceae bacterium]|nr:hypothetical protein [Anaerolineaceae bacterium]
MAGKFELKQLKNEQYLFNLKASNGQIILTSEQYKSKSGAVNGIESVRKNAVNESRFEVLESKNGEPYFVLKAGNGEVIGRSEIYSSDAACKNGIQSVMKNAPDAELVELS